MVTITVITNPSTWMIVTEIAGHSLFFIQAFWWLSIDQFRSAVALFEMAFFSLLYHLCILNIGPDPSHAPFFHGLDYTGISGLTHMLYFDIIMLPDTYALPLFILLQTFIIPGNWILYDSGYLPFGLLLSYVAIFGVTVLHRQHMDEADHPWVYSLRYWYVLVAGILGMMFAITLLYVGGNPGEELYEPVHGGAWHFSANVPLAIIMCFIVLIQKHTARALIPFFFVFREKKQKKV